MCDSVFSPFPLFTFINLIFSNFIVVVLKPDAQSSQLSTQMYMHSLAFIFTFIIINSVNTLKKHVCTYIMFALLI